MAKYSIFEENICLKECYRNKGRGQEYCTLELKGNHQLETDNSFFGWSGCFVKKTVLLCRISCLQRIVCWDFSRGIQLNRLHDYKMIFLSGQWKQVKKEKKKQHCLIFLAILPLAQCVALSLVNCCFAQLKLVQHCYVLCTSTPDTCLKTTDATGSFLNCPTEIGLVDESPGCVSKTSHALQKNVVSCTTNICRHDSSVTLRFKTRTLSIFHDACHKKKKKKTYLLVMRNTWAQLIHCNSAFYVTYIFCCT